MGSGATRPSGGWPGIVGVHRVRGGVLAAVLAAAVPAFAQSVLITPTTVEDLAYSATTGRLYVVLPAGVGGVESAVAELNPASGAVVTRVVIPDGPDGGATQLAVSDDGSTLYVGVNGGRVIRRYGLPAFSPGPEFGLGVNQFGEPNAVTEMAVAPGTTATLALVRAARFAPGVLTAFDGGVARPAEVSATAVAFFTATQVLDSRSGARYRLVASGFVADTPARETSAGGALVFDAGVAYEWDGVVHDLVARHVRGTCPARGAAVPATDIDRIFYFDAAAVVTCAPSTYTVVGRLVVPGLSAGIRAAARTGTGRFVLVDASRRLLVADGFDAPLPAPPAPYPGTPWFTMTDPVIAGTLPGCTTCRPGDAFSVAATVRNVSGSRVEVKAAIILPSGQALGVTALGTSHLVLRDLYGPVGATLLSLTMPPGLPSGRWFVDLALIDPDDGAVWSRSIVPFEVQP